MFKVGQGIKGQIRFKDGELSEKVRPYLIVKVCSEYIEVLTVSTIKGKERKLAFPTNKKIDKFKPPFLKPSFVKLDSLIKIHKSEWKKYSIIHNGETLDFNELNNIISNIKR